MSWSRSDWDFFEDLFRCLKQIWVKRIQDDHVNNMKELREEQRIALADKKKSNNSELENKRNELQLEEEQFRSNIQNMEHSMRMQAKEEQRSDIENHELRKREIIEKHQETISNLNRSMSEAEKSMREQKFIHQTKCEEIDLKMKLKQGDLAKAVRNDILEEKYNSTVQHVKHIWALISKAVTVVHKSLSNDDKQTISTRNREILVTLVKNKMDNLEEASEKVSNFKGYDGMKGGANTNVVKQILNKIVDVRNSLNTFLSTFSELDKSITAFKAFKDRMNMLNYAVSKLRNIKLKKHADIEIRNMELILYEWKKDCESAQNSKSLLN
ncbi:Protein containing ALS2cr12 (ALS2CR12) signature [Caenorhabditis elegans]|uniref:Protein containing ALS2cr12 (ALS2CR12) signature n=2 Tax=Caenorhabditis elegans TaxID=6239 RepID=A0A078BQI6_CAEEL|nr:Protein containing ALS2cr12 (ALS2CR12) signature [Caenorhabditis elegans]CDX47429.1 Protein containing ALS2cr12 (ALS2CR12) signature [Caenorhabditis elegans]|eukprot:NP_001293379.1 Protein containing ALS2cr12 (ALS2CR12) signature [Caenorhabditis elegans]